MDATTLEYVSETADKFWGRRVFSPSELDRATEEYNAIHDAANRLFGDQCLPVGRLDLIYPDWYAAGDLAVLDDRSAHSRAGRRS